jgi:hypothetical protein
MEQNSQSVLQGLIDFNSEEFALIAGTMGIYNDTKEIMILTSEALGKGVNYALFNSSSQFLNIEANEHHTNTTTRDTVAAQI